MSFSVATLSTIGHGYAPMTFLPVQRYVSVADVSPFSTQIGRMMDDELDPIEQDRLQRRESGRFKCGKRGPSIFKNRHWQRLFCTLPRGHDGVHRDVEEAPERTWGDSLSDKMK